jgi:hypothetical protein
VEIIAAFSTTAALNSFDTLNSLNASSTASGDKPLRGIFCFHYEYKIIKSEKMYDAKAH